MTTPSFTLYVDSNYDSPYAMSVFVTLVEKDVSYDLKTVNLNQSAHHQPDYVALSLTHRVPTLVHNGFHLNESSAIAEYLEELLPPPDYAAVYPTDRQQRAIARQIQAWMRSDFLTIREERPTTVIFSEPTDIPLSDAARAEANRLFEAGDRLLSSDSLNLFDDWCIADTDLALMINRLVLNGDEVPESLAAYAQHQWKRPSVQQWIQFGK
ncbi:MAG: glutathione transferase [Cyanobacteria bacterium J06627_8]